MKPYETISQISYELCNIIILQLTLFQMYLATLNVFMYNVKTNIKFLYNNCSLIQIYIHTVLHHII